MAGQFMILGVSVCIQDSKMEGQFMILGVPVCIQGSKMAVQFMILSPPSLKLPLHGCVTPVINSS